MLPRVSSRGEGGPKTAASDTCSENKDTIDPTFDQEAARAYADQVTAQWTDGDPSESRLSIGEIWQRLLFDPFYGRSGTGNVTAINNDIKARILSGINPVPQWMRDCPQQEFVHLLVARWGLHVYKPDEEEPFRWRKGRNAYRDNWLELEDCEIKRDEFKRLLTNHGLPLPRFWFPEEFGDRREQELEAKPAEWITGAKLVKQHKTGNLYKLVVSGKVIPWIEVPPLWASYEVNSPVRRERHRRLLPSYEADKKAQEINSLAFGIQSSERWLAQSNEEHYAVIKADSARKGKEPESYDSFKEYLSAVRREYDEKLPAMRADLDRLVKELDPATVWKTEFARLYPGGVPTGVEEDWLEKFKAASYEDEGTIDPSCDQNAAKEYAARDAEQWADGDPSERQLSNPAKVVMPRKHRIEVAAKLGAHAIFDQAQTSFGNAR